MPTAHATATTLTASPNNPYRTKLATGYAERTDRVVTNILARGSDLTTEQYTVYLTTISNGIRSLGQKPVYSGNPDVANVIGYLQHEVDAIKTQLANGSLFMDELTRMIDGSLAAAQATTTSGTTTPVGNNNSNTTGNTTVTPAPAVVTPAPAVVTTVTPAVTTATVQASTYSRVIEYYLCGNKEEVNGTISGVRLTTSYSKSQFGADARPIGVNFDRDEYGRPNGSYSAASYGNCNQICRGSSA